MDTLHEISLENLDVHFVSGCASHPEPEVFENACGFTLKNNFWSILRMLYIPKNEKKISGWYEKSMKKK